jgi:hypothetical protein
VPGLLVIAVTGIPRVLRAGGWALLA